MEGFSGNKIFFFPTGPFFFKGFFGIWLFLCFIYPPTFFFTKGGFFFSLKKRVPTFLVGAFCLLKTLIKGVQDPRFLKPISIFSNSWGFKFGVRGGKCPISPGGPTPIFFGATLELSRGLGGVFSFHLRGGISAIRGQKKEPKKSPIPFWGGAIFFLPFWKKPPNLVFRNFLAPCFSKKIKKIFFLRGPWEKFCYSFPFEAKIFHPKSGQRHCWGINFLCFFPIQLKPPFSGIITFLFKHNFHF